MPNHTNAPSPDASQHSYLVRIELHPSDADQAYSAVHDSMEAAGFSRKYRDADGVRYHLPTSEYFISSTKSPEAIRDLANSATRKVTTHFMLLVIQASKVAITGLVPVTEKTLPSGPSLVQPVPLMAAV